MTRDTLSGAIQNHVSLSCGERISLDVRLKTHPSLDPSSKKPVNFKLMLYSSSAGPAVPGALGTMENEINTFYIFISSMSGASVDPASATLPRSPITLGLTVSSGSKQKSMNQSSVAVGAALSQQ
jgi:hypothetical protein